MVVSGTGSAEFNLVASFFAASKFMQLSDTVFNVLRLSDFCKSSCCNVLSHPRSQRVFTGYQIDK